MWDIFGCYDETENVHKQDNKVSSETYFSHSVCILSVADIQ